MDKNKLVRRLLPYTVLTLAVFLFHGLVYFGPGSDFANYFQGAASFFSKLPYSTIGDADVADAFRPPGYSFVLFLVLSVADVVDFRLLMLLINLMLFLAIYYFTVKLGRPSNLNQNLILIIPFLLPTFLLTATSYQSDLFLILLTNMGIFLVFVGYRRHIPRYTLMGVLILSMSLYFRPTLMYFVPYLCLILFIFGNRRVALSGLFIFALVISPWIIRNGLLTGEYHFSSLTKIFPRYLAAEVMSNIEGISTGEALEVFGGPAEKFLVQGSEITTPRKSEATDPVNYMLSNPIGLFRASAKGAARAVLMPNEIYEAFDSKMIITERLRIYRGLNVSEIKKGISYDVYFIFLPILYSIYIWMRFMAGCVRKFKSCINPSLWDFPAVAAASLIGYVFLVHGASNKPHYLLLSLGAFMYLLIRMSKGQEDC